MELKGVRFGHIQNVSFYFTLQLKTTAVYNYGGNITDIVYWPK